MSRSTISTFKLFEMFPDEEQDGVAGAGTHAGNSPRSDTRQFEKKGYEMDQQTEALLAKIEAREQKATPGEWLMWSGGGYVSIGIDGPTQIAAKVLGASYGDGWNQNSDNYSFMAHARTDIPFLTKLVRQQAQELEQSRLVVRQQSTICLRAGLIAEALQDSLQQLAYIKRACPCGARPETPDTHPHVGGCGIEKLLTLARNPLPAPPEKGMKIK